MPKKILPIVYDKKKDLTKSLSILNITHQYCDYSDSSLYESLLNGPLQYINKIFFTTSEDLSIKLNNDFPGYLIYFVGKPLTRLPINISPTVDVNEPIYTLLNEGYSIYTNKELKEIKDELNRIPYELDICLIGRLHYSSLITNVSHVIDSIKINKLIDNKYFLKNTNTYYCSEKSDKNILIKNILKVDNLIEYPPFKESKDVDVTDIIEHVKSTKLYSLIDKSKYHHKWFALSSILDYIDSKKDNSQETKTNITKLMLVLDISVIDNKTKSLDLSDMVKYIFSDNKKNGDIIYLFKDVMAFGTPKIVKYYMSLFNIYGSYEFKKNIRDQKDIVFKKDVYDELNYKYRMLSESQLFEHINAYGDVILCKIMPIDIDNIGLVVREKKIIIVTYYGIYEQFLYVKRGLELLGYSVYDFPYMKLNNEGGDKKIYETMTQMLKELQPEYILWWVFNISANALHEIVQFDKKVRHLYFNWDEPFNWDLVDAKSKARYLNTAFITCSETTKKYIGAGALHSYCLYTGYSPKIHYPFWLDTFIDPKKYNYSFDISFICTNLYEDQKMYPDQIVNRKFIVETIYQGQKAGNYKFGIFGPENFKDKFPDSYQGFIKYDDTGKMFNKSKINLCTHVVGNKKGYLNERIFLILASGGLLLVDPVPGVEDILINGYNCIFINQDRLLSQIKIILDNYDQYDKIKKNAYKTAQEYTWNDWAMRLEEKLLQDHTY